MQRVGGAQTMQGNQIVARFVQTLERFGVEWSQKFDQLRVAALAAFLSWNSRIRLTTESAGPCVASTVSSVRAAEKSVTSWAITSLIIWRTKPRR